jgi:hypothetical protein
MVANPEGIEFSSRGRALRDAHGPRKDMGPDPERGHICAQYLTLQGPARCAFPTGGGADALGPRLLNRNLSGFLKAQTVPVPADELLPVVMHKRADSLFVNPSHGQHLVIGQRRQRRAVRYVPVHGNSCLSRG